MQLLAYILLLSKLVLIGNATGNQKIPDWVGNPPEDTRYQYFMGESPEVSGKEDALERAWISTLIRIGMTQFPEVSKLSSLSVESIKDADYQRKFVMSLEQIDWTGIREATEKGSPFVVEDLENGTYRVYRLLKWSKKAMDKARQKIAANESHQIPKPPEEVQNQENIMIDAVREINSINRENAKRSAKITPVMKAVKCGVTVHDLIRVLGAPDKQRGIDCSTCDKSYFWGTFQVESAFYEFPIVTRIYSELGHGGYSSVCK